MGRYSFEPEVNKVLTHEEIRLLERKTICTSCVCEAYLRKKINDEGENNHCSYCGNEGRCFQLRNIAELVEDAFDVHYFQTPDEPEAWESTLLADKESSYEWYRKGIPVIEAIMDAVEIPEEAAMDIQQVIEDKHQDYDLTSSGYETEFHSDSHYDDKNMSGANWLKAWYEFERDLKIESRFFNSAADTLLSDIFRDIDQIRTTNGDSIIVSAGPGSSLLYFFRARVFQSIYKLKEALKYPDKSIGPPPSNCALAGRMNAHGISVFYGANDHKTALAEVRPPVGSLAVLARFEIIRPIKLLDLSAVENMSMHGSIFDPLYADKLEILAFLRSLRDIITRPVMPNDEALEYIPTQAVADFLAAKSAPIIDGMLFPSVQTAGDSLNIVLFHKASKVDEIELPAGTKVTADIYHADEEMSEVEFVVREEVPIQKPNDKLINPPNPSGFIADVDKALLANSDPDHPTSYLKLDSDSIEVHKVSAVGINTDTLRVSRYRCKVSE